MRARIFVGLLAASGGKDAAETAGQIALTRTSSQEMRVSRRGRARG